MVGWLLVFPGQGVAVQVVASQAKTDRGHWEPEVNQMGSRLHQAEGEVPRVLGFRKTDLCRLDPAVRVGAGEVQEV